MPLNPAPPEDLAALTEGYAQTVQAVLDLGHSLRAGDLEKETDCPGWTVFDQIAHVTGGEAMVAGEQVPDVDVSRHAHVRHEFGERVEKYLEVRRGRHIAEILDELEALLAERLAFYRDPATTLETPTVGPYGATTVGDLITVRLFDIWTHEQDIREALARPGNLDAPGASVAVMYLFDALPRIIARTAAVPPGHAVILDLTGPVVGRAGARVEERDGKPVGIRPVHRRAGRPCRRGDDDDHDVDPGGLPALRRAAAGVRAPRDDRGRRGDRPARPRRHGRRALAGPVTAPVVRRAPRRAPLGTHPAGAPRDSPRRSSSGLSPPELLGNKATLTSD